MPYIYKITNKINGKCYIGKTLNTIEQRWQEHIRESKQARSLNRPLYKAINKYGIDNFSINIVEEIDNVLQIDINEREKYWIEYYQSFKSGYNATTGGDGKSYLDYNLIYEMYKELGECLKVAKILNIDEGTVSKIVKSCGGKVKYCLKNVNPPKIIHMYSLNDEYEQTFPSVQKAVEWCVKQGLCKTVNSGARSNIGNCANGKRKTAYQHKWKYAKI